MRIAILGGTGNIGKGLALRWGSKHEIIIGSRVRSKAERAAEEYREALSAVASGRGQIRGAANREAAIAAEIVVIAVPYSAMRELADAIRPVLEDQIVISLVVPMERSNSYLRYRAPPDGSAAMELKRLLPDTVRVVAAFHNLPGEKLRRLDMRLDCDVVVCGDSDAMRVVGALIEEIDDLRVLDGGGLEDSAMVESLTPFLINIAKRNNLSELGIKFV